uniref:Uncharacterized protein n=1 Tax=Nicotiana tabacum TaxID=4097 RepID=A0A1S4C873_TOBAC|nr:PREDICTED: uncharacterized protein LOC107816162 [Nicotiana tabacum]
MPRRIPDYPDAYAGRNGLSTLNLSSQEARLSPGASLKHVEPFALLSRRFSVVIRVQKAKRWGEGSRTSNRPGHINNSRCRKRFEIPLQDSLEKGTEHEDEYMISEKELLVNRFISITKDMGAFKCRAFVALTTMQ